jgi:uncharacterized protein YprB with RNaseH-like and TPR domain
MATPKLENILFLDIETAPITYKYAELAPAVKDLWDKKWAYNPENNPAELYSKAGVFAEFSKVICIGLGFYYKGKFRVKSIVNDDEKKLLSEFAELIKTHFNKKDEHFLCAHNGKEFDYPFLSRRMIINNVPFPRNFQLQGKKPWDVKHLDTMELWRFGDVKNFTSLNLLAHVLGIPSPKDELDGSMVGKVYHEEKNIDKIRTYCLKDVVTLSRVYSKYTGQKTVEEHDIVYT